MSKTSCLLAIREIGKIRMNAVAHADNVSPCLCMGSSRGGRGVCVCGGGDREGGGVVGEVNIRVQFGGGMRTRGERGDRNSEEEI
ncbi:hypothetical protein BaRGS_00008510 [Batillaria attramentaria]|uniref:Uncharacterized protein n=1 Tax=Batillaria attramentaria TaxID=370345 RepID=A0ABD0LLR2_9CAEN